MGLFLDSSTAAVPNPRMGFLILCVVAVLAGFAVRQLMISHMISQAEAEHRSARDQERNRIQALCASWGFDDIPTAAELHFRYRHLLALVRTGYATPFADRQGLEWSRAEIENFLHSHDTPTIRRAVVEDTPNSAAFLIGALLFVIGIASDSLLDASLTPADVSVSLGEYGRRNKLFSSNDGITLHGAIQNRSSSTVGKVVLEARLTDIRRAGAAAYIMDEREVFSVREEIAPGETLRFSHDLDDLVLRQGSGRPPIGITVKEVDAKGWLGIF